MRENMTYSREKAFENKYRCFFLLPCVYYALDTRILIGEPSMSSNDDLYDFLIPRLCRQAEWQDFGVLAATKLLLKACFLVVFGKTQFCARAQRKVILRILQPYYQRTTRIL